MLVYLQSFDISRYLGSFVYNSPFSYENDHQRILIKATRSQKDFWDLKKILQGLGKHFNFVTFWTEDYIYRLRKKNKDSRLSPCTNKFSHAYSYSLADHSCYGLRNEFKRCFRISMNFSCQHNRFLNYINQNDFKNVIFNNWIKKLSWKLIKNLKLVFGFRNKTKREYFERHPVGKSFVTSGWEVSKLTLWEIMFRHYFIIAW